MNIQDKTVVTLNYELFEGSAEGTFVEKTDDANPLVFVYGVGQMIAEFENNLKGLTIGDQFEFGITSDKAYGPVNPEAIVPLPIDIFAENKDALFEGNVIPMRNDQGHQMVGKVIDLNDAQVTMDFNHPMAGKDLWFKGQITKVREANDEEIQHGHVHGEGGVTH